MRSGIALRMGLRYKGEKTFGVMIANVVVCNIVNERSEMLKLVLHLYPFFFKSTELSILVRNRKEFQ